MFQQMQMVWLDANSIYAQELELKFFGFRIVCAPDAELKQMLLLRRQVEISTRRKISYKNFFDILL
jgi:hypothetical protein